MTEEEMEPTVKIIGLAQLMGMPQERLEAALLPLIERMEHSHNPLSDLLWVKENADLSVTEKMVCAMIIAAVL